jgi:cytochrome b6-f complex iron-sulfur subunit
MASAVTTAEGKTKAVSTERAAEVEVSLPSRREFLYYIWGASLVLLLGQTGAGLIWFALPRFKEGTFGGVFNFPPERVPQMNTAPVTIPEGRFHVVHVDGGVNVLYQVCTHLGCLPKWNIQENRFLCPCHGSQFAMTGQYLAGPAPRSLDRFETTVFFSDGTSATTNAKGDPIAIDGKTVVRIAINTGKRVNRGDRS